MPWNSLIQEEKPPDQEIANPQAILTAMRVDVNLAKQRLMEHFEHLQIRIQRTTNG